MSECQRFRSVQGSTTLLVPYGLAVYLPPLWYIRVIGTPRRRAEPQPEEEQVLDSCSGITVQRDCEGKGLEQEAAKGFSYT